MAVDEPGEWTAGRTAVPAISRATMILAALDAAPEPLTFGDLARLVPLPRSSLHNFAGNLGQEAFGQARNLRWIHSWAAGVDGGLFPELVTSPVVLTSSKGNGAIPLAEHALMLMLMLMLNRDAPRWMRAQDSRTWDRFPHGDLSGLTCGIIGMGNAGAALARRAAAFDMRVIGLRRNSSVPAAGVDRMYSPAELAAFLAVSDFVVVTAALTPETRGMIGHAEFGAMKPTAFYICVSRGGIADDAELLTALQEGRIAGAGLDAMPRSLSRSCC